MKTSFSSPIFLHPSFSKIRFPKNSYIHLTDTLFKMSENTIRHNTTHNINLSCSFHNSYHIHFSQSSSQFSLQKSNHNKLYPFLYIQWMAFNNVQWIIEVFILTDSYLIKTGNFPQMKNYTQVTFQMSLKSNDLKQQL